MTHDADQRLVEAVGAGDDVAVGRALAEGADPDAMTDRFGGSVLNMAAGDGRRGIVLLLLDAGARLAPAHPGIASPLRIAVMNGHPDVVQCLVTRDALSSEPPGWRAVLTDAVDYARHHPGPAMLETLRVLLRAGAVQGPGDQGPLITAIMGSASPAVLRILLDHGADPGQRRSDAVPAIVIAARLGDHAAVDVLVQAGADVDASDSQGRTALMHAAERGERRVAAALLLAGAAIGAVSADGMTALQLAQGWQRQDIQHMLGQHRTGLDNVPITRTVLRVTPAVIQLAGDPEMFQLLASAIGIAVDDLGDQEWQIRTGTSAEAASAFAARLRQGAVPAGRASWHQLDATARELSTARAALLELAHGTTRKTPEGTSRLQITDMLAELDRQLGC